MVNSAAQEGDLSTTTNSSFSWASVCGL